MKKSELKCLIIEEIKKILEEDSTFSKRNFITTKRTQEDIKKIQNVIEYFNKAYDL